MRDAERPDARVDVGTIRVVIAEDEAVPRQRLARLPSREPDVHLVAQCSGGEDAVQRVVEEHPDVVFLDVQMPDLDARHPEDEPCGD